MILVFAELCVFCQYSKLLWTEAGSFEWVLPEWKVDLQSRINLKIELKKASG
jgi:hypothetical protein